MVTGAEYDSLIRRNLRTLSYRKCRRLKNPQINNPGD